jgi:DNA-binding NarL/FixJ family response regulator
MAAARRPREGTDMSTMVTLAHPTRAESSATGAIRVVVACAQPALRAGMCVLVERQAGITVVGEAATGEEVIRLARDARPDVVLIDAAVPDCDCVDATRRIRAGDTAAVVIIGEIDSDSRVFAALRAGAARRLHTDGAPDELLRAIRQSAWSTAPRRHAGRRRRQGCHHFTTPKVVELVPRDRLGSAA